MSRLAHLGIGPSVHLFAQENLYSFSAIHRFFFLNMIFKIFFKFLIAKLSSLCGILIEKLPLFVFKYNSELQGMPDLFMCDMSGA